MELKNQFSAENSSSEIHKPPKPELASGAEQPRRTAGLYSGFER